ncbi:MAG TPA: helix-turn-helix domain-containing protein [Rudaea sp.]|nr:helix-turn-helix domain-containing protein [Rudaea sp.]
MPSQHCRIQTVLVVVPPRLLLLDIAGPVEVLRKVDQIQESIRFDVRYVGPSAALASSIGLSLANVEPLPNEIPDGAMIVIPGNVTRVLGAPPGCAEREDADETAIVAWLRSAVDDCHRVVCICNGAFLAARAGLLDGRECTTHHTCTDELQALAPRARVRENRIFVEDGPCLTSAGVTAGVDLMLHVAAQMLGPALALAVARFLVVYLRRSSSDPQLSPWLEGRNHLHPAIHRVQDAILADPARPWRLGDLGRLVHVSARTLSRLFNAQTQMSVTDYVNRVRIALARELVEQSRLDMETVAERAGFASARQFRRAWSRLYGAPPRESRRSAPAAEQQAAIPAG